MTVLPRAAPVLLRSSNMAAVQHHWDHVLVTWKGILLHCVVTCVLCIQNEMGVDSNLQRIRPGGNIPKIIDGLDIAFSSLPNLLVNPSFEEAFPRKWNNPWKGGKATLSRVHTNTSKDGEYTMLVQKRKTKQDGASQIVRGLKPGKGYALSGFIRIMKDKPNTLWQRVKVTLQFTFTDDPEAQNYQTVLRDEGSIPEGAASDAVQATVSCARSGLGQKSKAMMKPDRSQTMKYTVCYRSFLHTKGEEEHGWVPLEGNINAPMREFADEVTLRIAGPDPEVDFQVDDLKLVEVPPYDDWLTRATRESDIHRKASFSIKFTLPPGVSAKDIDVEVKLKNPLFAFGVKVEDDCMLVARAHRYREFVSKVFNWVTIGSYKWKFDKGTRNKPDFSNAINANNVALNLGLKVRAHSILWDIEENTPDWVHDVSDAELPEVVRQHVGHMINITRGRVEQWDVQNEMVLGHYYEERLQDPMFTAKMFMLARELDPKVRLYLNDFQAVTTGSQVAAMIGLVKRFRAFGAEINGVGIQGHTKDYVKPDPPMVWRRLNEFGKIPDLDVMVTEFDLGHDDDVTRADWLEDTMRAFYAHPVVKGVILWGFWSERMRYENKFLVYGEKFEMSETGRRFACLVEKEWTTRLTFNLANHPQQLVQLRGYKGDYDVIIRNKNTAIQRESFALMGNNEFSISVQDTNTPIEVPDDNDLMNECVSHRHPQSLGEMQSVKTQPGIQCTSRNSTVTSGAEETKAEVTCSSQEVMTGCSGSVSSKYSAEENIQARLGESITFEGGVPKCNAFLRSSRPQGQYQVTAEARCCVIPGLKCDYRRAGPSLLMEDAMAEASCLKKSLALGCSTFNLKSLLKGVVYRGDNPTSCVGKSGPPMLESKAGGASGVMTSVACCARPGLNCVVVKSGISDAGNVSCPRPEQIMTSCAAQGTSSGASACKDPKGNVVCRVQGSGVVALATCCSVQGLRVIPSDVTPSCTAWGEGQKPGSGKPEYTGGASSLQPLLGFFGILLNVAGVFILSTSDFFSE